MSLLVLLLAGQLLTGQELVIAPSSYLADSVILKFRDPNAPRASDVPMRSLAPRPISKEDPHNTLAAIRQFHVTRLEWAYELDADFVQETRKLGVKVSGTLNLLVVSDGGVAEVAQARRIATKDLRGQPTVAPWMRPWRPVTFWMCLNNPGARMVIAQRLQKLVTQRLDGIQFDDPTGNVRSLDWGACYCSFCVAGFSFFLAKEVPRSKLVSVGIADPERFNYADFLRNNHKPNPSPLLSVLYREFQYAATNRFHKWWQSLARADATPGFALSVNVTAMQMEAPTGDVDFWLGELQMTDATPAGLHKISDIAQAHGRVQVLTMPIKPKAFSDPSFVPLARRAIATAYATGMLMEVPWDTYLPIDFRRYFGRPADFADLYAFVRACRASIEGYEEAAASGRELSVKNSASSPVTFESESPSACLFVRVKPGDHSAPIVIHLVDWANQPGEIGLRIELSKLFGGAPVRAELLSPVPYDLAAHALASSSHDYSPLVHRRSLKVQPDGSLQVPPINPWGIVILFPSQ